MQESKSSSENVTKILRFFMCYMKSTKFKTGKLE